MEIKTFRCEICGKTYHSDECDTEMIIAVKEKDKESKDYNCICPECSERMTAIIKQPNFIKEISERYNKAKSKLSDLVYKVNEVYNNVTGMYGICPSWCINENIDIDNQISKLKTVLEQYKLVDGERFAKYMEVERVKKSRNSWRSTCSALIGFSTVLLLKLIFG